MTGKISIKIVQLDGGVGGVLGDTITSLNGKKFKCHCDHDLEVGVHAEFSGYLHSNGLADGTGKKYWLFLECPYCGYKWAWLKVEAAIKSIEEKVT